MSEKETIYRVVEVQYQNSRLEESVFTTDFEKALEEVRSSAEMYSEDVLVEVIKPDNDRYDDALTKVEDED